jgi:tRNA U34 5-methylaminomethyl-2-thiouridine-forming methyltransferase MnmC
MASEFIQTHDGSYTLYDEKFADHYHSLNGAFSESMHIYIRCGFHRAILNKNEINLLEVGFGTGLNALCTLVESKKHKVKVNYTAIEPFPVSQADAEKLHYPGLFKEDHPVKEYLKLHYVSADMFHNISEHFSFQRIEVPLENCDLPFEHYDLVYFDPFKPVSHEYIWSAEMFSKLNASMKVNAKLITYSSRGSVRRAMKEAGFCVTKLPGPDGKREISFAEKHQCLKVDGLV